jgi:Sulfotransferase family
LLPNFFIIGAPKCGTTSLHTYLAAHPEIHMSPIKEPRFFAEADPELPFEEPRVGARAEYERLFDSPLPFRGESSPSYSQYPRRRGVPERIHALIPEARFVYLVRDPIDRAVSHYMQRSAYEAERRPFREALGDLADPMNPYLCASRYATQIERYHHCFPADRVLVVDQSALRDDRVATLREVFSFLGADPDFESPVFAESVNVGYRRLPTAYVAVRRSGLGRLVRRLPKGMHRRIARPVRSLLSSTAERPEIDETLQDQLREALADEVRRLRLLTGKEFASWSV